MLLLGSDFTLRPSWLQGHVSATTWQCTRFWSSQISSMARLIADLKDFQPMVSGGDKANAVLRTRSSRHSAYTYIKICDVYWDKGTRSQAISSKLGPLPTRRLEGVGKRGVPAP